MSKLILITAGETCWPGRPEDAFIVTTKGGRQLANFEQEDDAKRFIADYDRKRKK